MSTLNFPLSVITPTPTHLVLLDEADERCAFDLHRLAGTIVQRYDEVEEVRFPKVARRLLLEMSAAYADPETRE